MRVLDAGLGLRLTQEASFQLRVVSVRSLMATRRRRRGSQASKTRPMPPVPSAPTGVYRCHRASGQPIGSDRRLPPGAVPGASETAAEGMDARRVSAEGLSAETAPGGGAGPSVTSASLVPSSRSSGGSISRMGGTCRALLPKSTRLLAPVQAIMGR